MNFRVFQIDNIRPQIRDAVEYVNVNLKPPNRHAVPYQSILLFESLGVFWVLSYPVSPLNHTSYRNFISMNLLQMSCVISDNMGMIIFDLQGCGSC